MVSKVSEFGHGQRRLIAIECPGGGWNLWSDSEIRHAYRQSKSLQELGQSFRLGSLLARKLLELAGIDYVADLHRQYMRERNCEALAKTNGLAATTLRKLLKDRGFEVLRGRPRPLLSQKQLADAVLASKTVNQVAKRFRLHWQTTFELLIRVRFVKTVSPAKYLPILPERPPSGWCVVRRW